MKWFILLVGIVVLCLVVALLLGLAGGGLGRASSSLSHEPLPDEPLADTDFDDLVFDVGARGYRMSQVDGVVDRLRRELREKDEEIAVLRGAHVRAENDGAAAEASPEAEPADDAAAESITEPITEPAPEPGEERTAEPVRDPDPSPTPTPDPVAESGTRVDDEGGARATSAPTGGHERTP